MTLTKREQILSGVTAQIEAGLTGFLPTTPELMAAYAASAPTVRAAIRTLKDRGLVEFVPGLGVRVVGRDVETKKEPSADREV